MKRTTVFLWIVLFINVILIPTAIIVSIRHSRYSQARRAFLSLIGGNENTKISRFEIYGHRERVICHHQPTLRYLQTVFSGAINDYDHSGASYSMRMSFRDGVTYDASIRVSEEWIALSVPEANPPEPGFMTHYVEFPEPIPKQIEEILELLNDDSPKNAGVVLTIGSDGVVRRTRQ